MVRTIVVLNLILITPKALAADVPPDVRATAEALYQEAYQLTQAGKHAEACKKLEESDRLDPATGTKMELAKCYEKTSRPASAWALYVTAADADKLTGKNKAREAEAREKAAALFPHLPRLVVDVPESIIHLPDLRIERDGVAIGKTLWGTPQTVDLGTHTVRVTAKGKLAWETKIATKEDATATLQVPDTLEEDPAANDGPSINTNKTIGDTPAHRDGRGYRTAAFVSLGLGGASLVAGGIFGGLALKQWEGMEKATADDCLDLANYKGCSKPLQDIGDRASTYATLSTVTFALGGTAVATGLVLLILAPPKPKTSGHTMMLIPQASRTSAFVSVIGGF